MIKIPKDMKEARREWIQKRAKTIANFQKTDYETATNMASLEWEGILMKSSHAIQREAVEVKDFPRFNYVLDESLPTLESILKNMIANNGRMTYFDVLHTLMLKDGKAWTGWTWHEFCAETLLRAKDILEYFGVKKGRFLMKKDSREHDFLEFEGTDVRK